MISNTLTHHGVKGMKWGVRRYQNKDGSLTEAGKKKLASRIKEAAKDTSYEGRKQLRKDIYDDLTTNYSKQMQDHIVNIKAKLKVLQDLDSPENDYWESGTAAKDSAVAYEKTLNWFKKNDPQHLNEIIKLNGGSDRGLDAYHDFRKTFEGYEDVEWTAGQKRFFKEKGIDPNASDKAYRDWSNACKDASKSILGQYGDTKVSSTGGWRSDENVNDIVADALQLTILQDS